MFHVVDITLRLKGREYVVKTDRRYTETDEWALLRGNIVIVGITDYAQKELKDIVAIELPEIGRTLRKGEEVGMIDSIKATSPYYTPVSGRVIEVNKQLESTPELLNKDPYGQGWIMVLEIEKPEEYEDLLTPETYAHKLSEKKK